MSLKETVELVRAVDSLRHDADLYSGYPYDPYGAPLAAALDTALARLLELDDAEGLGMVIHTHEHACEVSEERDERARKQRAEEYAEAERRHAFAIKVACPHCGASPGDTCRSTSGVSKGINDHRARWNVVGDG